MPKNNSNIILFILESEKEKSSFIFKKKLIQKIKYFTLNKFSSSKYKKIYLISLTNLFFISPRKLSTLFKKTNHIKTLTSIISKNFRKSNSGDIEIKFKPILTNKLISKTNHISKILLDLIQYNENEIKLYLIFILNKIIIIGKDGKKLFFYNQFEYTNFTFLKYLILISEEYGLDREKLQVILIQSNNTNKEIENKICEYFKNIIKYKKSIFEIIYEFYK